MRMGMGAAVAAGAAAVLAVSLGAVASTAVTVRTWTVRPGGAVTATAGRTTLTDTTTGNSLACPSSTLSGTLKSGSGLPGTGIGSIATVPSIYCPTPAGPSFTLMARDLPWHLNVSSYTASTGVVTGSLSHLQIAFTGPGCRAVIDGTSGTAGDGSVEVSYTNSTGRLKLLTADGNLHFYNVMGCFGLINSGDDAALSARFTVSPRQAITSP